MNQSWHCEKCKTKGVVTLPDDIDVISAVVAILKAHIAVTAKGKDGACGGGIWNIRTTKPVYSQGRLL